MDISKQVEDLVINLQKLEQSVMYTNGEISEMVYDIRIPAAMRTYYYPNITYQKSPKCDKCNKDRLVRTGNVTCTEYIVCECDKLHPLYETKDITAEMNADTMQIIAFDDDNKRYVLNNSTVLFSSKEDCDEYCKKMNMEVTT